MVVFSTERLGKSISELRKSLGLTQKQLADSICTQALISKIERGEVMPSADMIFKISNQLGVDVNYFLKSAVSSRSDFVEETFTRIREAIQKRDYLEVNSLIHHVRKHPSFQSKIHQQFLFWHQGICEYHINNTPDRALDLMNQALNLTASNKEQLTEREIEILNSIGIIYSEISEYENSISYFNRALEQLKYVPYLSDKFIKVRIYYNLAKNMVNPPNKILNATVLLSGLIATKVSW